MSQRADLDELLDALWSTLRTTGAANTGCRVFCSAERPIWPQLSHGQQHLWDACRALPCPRCYRNRSAPLFRGWTHTLSTLPACLPACSCLTWCENDVPVKTMSRPPAVADPTQGEDSPVCVTSRTTTSARNEKVPQAVQTEPIICWSAGVASLGLELYTNVELECSVC
ncbi:uncharacterized protein LOC143292026 [Babylonia areolata]|uniref:uncharacterized protein LOC143292026 n=1 Tax=Babylonia areolata TaxID=304850 RepID=UPI003FD3B8E2